MGNVHRLSLRRVGFSKPERGSIRKYDNIVTTSGETPERYNGNGYIARYLEKVPVFTLGSPDARSISRGKRAVGGSLIFAAFDHDALLQAMKEVWHIIAPPAMFTAAGNLALVNSEDFSRAMDMARGNAASELSFINYNEFSGILNVFYAYINQNQAGRITQNERQAFDRILIGVHNMDAGEITSGIEQLKLNTSLWDWMRTIYIDPGSNAIGETVDPNQGGKSFLQVMSELVAQIQAGPAADAITGFMAGFAGDTELKQQVTTTGSNNRWNWRNDTWEASNAAIKVPQGFAAIRGQNVTYADIIPPFDITLTFANEYGQCAFKKIYDCDILNEGSGVSVDTVVMEQQFSYIARRVSPLTRGVYTRESGGMVKGIPPVVDPGFSSNYGYRGPAGDSYIQLP